MKPFLSWKWLGMGMELPSDWEMLRYARDPDNGRCVFADRYQHRLEFCWQKVPQPPDHDRMLADYTSWLQEAGADALISIREEKVADWRGMEVTGGDMPHSRYGAYLADTSRMVECVFFWPEDMDTAVRDHVLQSIAPATPCADGSRPWQALGMTFRVCEDLHLAECGAKPASVQLVFLHSQHTDWCARFERIGMLRHWFSNSVSNWLRSRIDPKTVVTFCRETMRSGHHKVVELHGTRKRFLRLRGGRSLTIKAWAWICPSDGRLYMETHEVPARLAATAPSVSALSCCDAGRWGGAVE